LFSDRRSNWTGRDTLNHAARRAGSLAQAGVRKGDRVALLCTNRAEFLEVVLGCGWLGAIVVPINTASRGMQLQHILTNSGAKLLVVESSLTTLLTDVDFTQLAIQEAWIIESTSDAPTFSLPVPA